MYSLAFPKMFNSTSLRVIEGHEATYSNLRLLLLSDTTMLLGDPYYGTPLRQVIFSQNDGVVKDLAIDAIYTSILTFMPQLVLQRKDIQIVQQQNEMYVKITATNILDYTTNLYEIKLTDTEKY